MNNKLLKNGLYNAVSGVVKIGFGLLTIPLLIHLIGVEEYGLWTLASAVVSMVALAEAGLSTATTVFLSQDLAKEDVDGLSHTLTVTIGAMLILATLAAITLWVGAEEIVGFFPKLSPAQQLVSVQALKISGFVVWVRLLQQIAVGVEQAYQNYGVMNLLITLQSVLSSLGFLAVAWLGGRTVALMQWQALISLGILLLHIWAGWLLVEDMKPRIVWSKTKGLSVFEYSFKTWFALLGGTLFSQVDRLIVGGLLGTETLGVYAAITNITVQINAFSAWSVQPLLPTISNLIAKQDHEPEILQHKVKQAVKINGIVALGIGSALFTFAPDILNLLVSNISTSQEVWAFRIAIIIYSLYSVNAVGYYILFAVNSVTTCMNIQLVSGILSLVSIAIGAIYFEMLGAIVGNAGYILTLLLNLFAMKKLSIPLILWAEWIQFPLICFILEVLVNVLISDKIGIKVLILALEYLSLSYWFIRKKPNSFKLIK